MSAKNGSNVIDGRGQFGQRRSAAETRRMRRGAVVAGLIALSAVFGPSMFGRVFGAGSDKVPQLTLEQRIDNYDEDALLQDQVVQVTARHGDTYDSMIEAANPDVARTNHLPDMEQAEKVLNGSDSLDVNAGSTYPVIVVPTAANVAKMSNQTLPGNTP